MDSSLPWRTRGRMLLAFVLLPLTPLVAVAGGVVVVFVVSASFFLLVTAGSEHFWQIFGWSLALSFGLVGVYNAPVLLRALGRVPENPLLSLETRPADEELEATVRQLVMQVDLPMPDVRVVEADAPEAFTVRRRRDEEAAVAVSEGLLATLDESELEAVLAHEVSHLNDRDNVVMAWVTLPLSAAREVALERRERMDDGDRAIDLLLMQFLLEVFAGACAAAVAVGREYAADAGAAAITGDPAALASALVKLDDELDGPPVEDLREHPEVATLNVVPAGGGGRFSTHPPTEKRIERLRRMAGQLHE